GVAVSVVYRNGRLETAATRGDGTTGDLITQHVRTIRSLPVRLPKSGRHNFKARAEVFMPKAKFVEMNKRREEAGETLFINPRNATAGTLKSLDSRVVARRPLEIIFHGFGWIGDDVTIETQSDFYRLLDASGLRK